METTNNHNNENSNLSSIYNFFEHFIKDGRVYKEKEIAPQFKIKLKALNSEELLSAETVVSSATGNELLADVAVRIRACAILSFSLVTLNGEDVYTEDELNIFLELSSLYNFKNLLSKAVKFIRQHLSMFTQYDVDIAWDKLIELYWGVCKINCVTQ